MLGAIKKLFSRKSSGAAESSAISSSVGQQTRSAAGASGAAASDLSQYESVTPGVMAEGESLQISLRSLVHGMPKELQTKHASSIPSDATIKLFRGALVAQLSQGAVRVPFGLIRKLSPAGIFPNATDNDNKLVDVPLKELIKSLGSAAFSRRADQKVIEVSKEIEDLFGTKGQGLRVLKKDELKPVSGAPATGTLEASAPAAAPAAPIAAPAITPSASSPAPAPASAPQPIRFSTTPPQPAPPPAIPAPSIPMAGAPIPAPALPKPAAPPLPRAPLAPTPAAPPRPATPLAPGMSDHLVLDLTAVCGTWPEGVRREISQWRLAEAKLHLPISEIQDALKQGRVNYTWKKLCTHLKPPVPSTAVSSQEQTILELPIAVVASAFFAQSQASKSTKPPPSVQSPLPEFSLLDSIKQQAAQKPAQPAAPPQQRVAPAPVPPPAPAPAPISAPAAIRMQPTSPAPAPAPAAATRASSGATIPIKVGDISANWPEGLRKEIDFLELGARQIEFPVESLENGLKTGKIDFFWKQLCGWIQNCPPAALASSFADTRLDLPLAILAPIFLKNKPSGPRKAAAMDHIPDIFGPGGEFTAPPEEAPAPAPAPRARAAAPAPAPARPHPIAEIASSEPTAGTNARNLAELFGQPDKRNWTPNEIVHHTTHLPGIAGALIALQDGLLVANCMPPQLKTETIAAFLPQIFGRLSQYAKELGMGDLQSVNIAVEQGTVQIYKAGIIYFAAMGKPDSILPLAALNLIATELSRHTK